MRKAYQSDLSDAEWSFLGSHLPAPNATGRPKTHPTREILNAVFYIVRGGCAWRLLPNDFPPWKTVSTTTSAPGGWTEHGRGCTPPYANECEFASRGTLSPAQR
jgi:transposase